MAAPPKPIGRLSGEFPDWGPAELELAATWTSSRLRELGIRVDARSRLEQSRIAINRIERFDVQLAPGYGPTEQLYTEAARTIFQQHFVVRNIDSSSRIGSSRLRRMLSGPVTPSPGVHDPGRDAEAELFTAAIFKVGGYSVEWAEPDLIIEDADGRLGIAVKRVTSLDDGRYKRRVREADKQLQRQGIEGFVMVHVDQLLATMPKDLDASPYLFEKVAAWVEHLNLAHPCTVVGVIAYGQSFRMMEYSPRRLSVTFHFVPVFVVPDDAPETTARIHEYSHRLANGFSRGLADAMRLK